MLGSSGAAPPESYLTQRLSPGIFEKSRKKTAQKLSNTKTFPKDFEKINKNPERCGFSKNTKTFLKDFQKNHEARASIGPRPNAPRAPCDFERFLEGI